MSLLVYTSYMCLYVHGEDVIETNKILQILLEEFVCSINQ